MDFKLDSSLTELDDLQKDSVISLTDLSNKSELIDKFNEEKSSSSSHKIQLSIEFYNWLDEIEHKIEEIDETSLNNTAITEMKAKHRVCSNMLDEVNSCLDSLNKLKELYLVTSNKTNNLHEACESLLNDQNTYTETAKIIEERLKYFLIVDNLAMKISFPNLKVSVDNIKPILDQIDNSYQFLSKKVLYKESSNYLTKLEDLLQAILGKIYSYFTNEINYTFTQLANKDEISQEKSFTLLYGKFRSQAIKVRPFIELISTRKDVWHLYLDMLRNCESFYLTKREQLLTRIITASITDLVSKYKRDHCSFVRSGGALMMRLCDDELNLYQQFFVNSSDNLVLLKDMLTRLCSILYDAFRPSIIHINYLETLSELCCILKMELVENYVNKPTLASDYSPIDRMCQMILQDVQERLVFRTHIYIRSEILNYQPSAGDLAYPEKLQMIISIAESIKSQHNTTDDGSSSTVLSDQQQLSNTPGTNVATTNGVSSHTKQTHAGGDLMVTPGPNMSLSPADLHGMWYPTVRRTLVCLSKLQRCLDITTFQGLAQECVAQCVESLVSAAHLIEVAKTKTDCQLFLIKHLLILREQVAPFNVEFSVKETSLTFTNIKNAAVGLISSRYQLLVLNRSNSLLRFLLETPDVIETVIDSRHQLDGRLKVACDSFIQDSVYMLVGPLNDFLGKIATLETIRTDTKVQVKIRDQAFTEVTKVQYLVAQCTRELTSVTTANSAPNSTGSSNSKFSLLRQNLHLYLSNPDTESILLRPIKNGVLKAYRSFNIFLANYYSEEDVQIISCPSEKQISLKMEIDMISK